ncbi:hypothetical protein H6F44_13570 [Pseudanabaena sp. FACHB-1277]|uniref:Uncharacterized protein n=1 Tax=Pseudanabaena cinerea FACHB-1277 TaxID=2949581 RepID=A0A926UUK2_9CYAN|nr:hypothetical protein [Pseudanabaena cinerea]MBD2151141.1 hypothetical protein [Pseudanabaena cinerea FACHB-1277]
MAVCLWLARMGRGSTIFDSQALRSLWDIFCAELRAISAESLQDNAYQKKFDRLTAKGEGKEKSAEGKRDREQSAREESSRDN